MGSAADELRRCVDAHTLNHSAELIVPWPAAPLPDELTPCAAAFDGTCYWRVCGPLAALLQPDFIERHVRHGALSAFSTTALDGGGTSIAITPRGELLIMCDRCVYECLGLTGLSSAYGQQRSRSCVLVRLLDPSVAPGKPGHTRLVHALEVLSSMQLLLVWQVDGRCEEPSFPPGISATRVPVEASARQYTQLRVPDFRRVFAADESAPAVTAASGGGAPDSAGAASGGAPGAGETEWVIGLEASEDEEDEGGGDGDGGAGSEEATAQEQARGRRVSRAAPASLSRSTPGAGDGVGRPRGVRRARRAPLRGAAQRQLALPRALPGADLRLGAMVRHRRRLRSSALPPAAASHVAPCARSGCCEARRWTGMLGSASVLALLDEAAALLERLHLTWAVVCVWGFSDAPVSWGLHEHARHASGAENDFVVVLLPGGRRVLHYCISSEDAFKPPAFLQFVSA
jgi:hypothetical protein